MSRNKQHLSSFAGVCSVHVSDASFAKGLVKHVQPDLTPWVGQVCLGHRHS